MVHRRRHEAIFPHWYDKLETPQAIAAIVLHRQGQGNITEVTFVSLIIGQRFFPSAFSPIADGPV